MYGNCKQCNQIYGTVGTSDLDGRLIMFQECEHITKRDKYKVISFQEAMDETASEGKLNKLRFEALKNNKTLWIQTTPEDFVNKPDRPEDVSLVKIKGSTLPYQIADKMTVVFPGGRFEMILKERYKL